MYRYIIYFAGHQNFRVVIERHITFFSVAFNILTVATCDVSAVTAVTTSN